jgi:hypothetical protein
MAHPHLLTTGALVAIFPTTMSLLWLARPSLGISL